MALLLLSGQDAVSAAPPSALDEIGGFLNIGFAITKSPDPGGGMLVFLGTVGPRARSTGGVPSLADGPALSVIECGESCALRMAEALVVEDGGDSLVIEAEDSELGPIRLRWQPIRPPSFLFSNYSETWQYGEDGNLMWRLVVSALLLTDPVLPNTGARNATITVETADGGLVSYGSAWMGYVASGQVHLEWS